MALLCGKISTIPRLEKMNSLSSNTDEVINFHLCAPKVGYARLNGENDESSVIPRQALVLGAKLSYQDLETISLPGQTPAATSPASEAPPAKLLRLVNTRGSFAFVFWEKKKEVLWLGTDRYGLKPFFYYHWNSEFAFATNLDWLVRHSSRKFRVNYSALSQYICLRHPFGNETLFQEINRLPQGVFLRYSVQEDRLTTVPFFSYLSLRPDLSITPEQVLVEGPTLFTAALEREISGAQKAVLPLSGGYDSRMIACGLHRLGVELLTYTTHKDYSLTTDTVAAADVAKILGATHHTNPLPTNYVARFHQQKCRLVNFETSYHPWIINLLSMFPEEPLPCFDGLGGDACLGGSEITPQFWTLWRKEKYDQFSKVYFQWYKTNFKSLVTAKYHRGIRALTKTRINREIDCVKGNPNGLIYLGLRNFTRRAISLSTFGILGHQRPIRIPFFDYEFFAWSLAIPVRLKVKVKIYSQLFKIYSGKTFVIPNTNQPSDGSRYFQKSTQIWRKRPNRVYLVKILNQLKPFLPGFIQPDLTEKVKKNNISRSHRDALFALADITYWFITYQNYLKIRGWMK